MLNKKQIQELCKKYNIRPERSRGQNFLVDQQVLDDIVAAAGLTPDDWILEVGAGFGILTFALLPRVRHVWAIESDRKIAEILEKNLEIQHRISENAKKYVAGHEHEKKVEVIAADIRKLNLPALMGEKSYKVVANLPYNITSWFLRVMLEQENQPKTITLLVQKEVAQRITAKEGECSLLSLSVQYFARPKMIRHVSKTSFWPQPEIDSSILHLADIHIPHFSLQKDLFRLLRMAFAGKRKQLHNTLSLATNRPKKEIRKILEKNAIDSTARPQDWGIEIWKNVTEILLNTEEKPK